ncbi:NHL domain-containing protein [Actinophytocola sp. KF-1]
MHSRSRAAALLAVAAALLAVSAPAQAAPPRPGQVALVAGLGPTGFSGDGGPAKDARIEVSSIAVGADGSVYLTDTERVRRVTPDGVIDTVYAPATRDGRVITGMAALPGGGLYLTLDDRDERVLGRMDPRGVVTVVAREAALGAATSGPGTGDDVAVDADGNAYLYDATRKRVVRVDAAGRVTRVGQAAIDVPGARLAVTRDRTVLLTAVQNPAHAGGSVQALGPAGPPRTLATTATRPPSEPAVAADGRVYYVDLGREQVVRLGEDGRTEPVGPALDGIGDLAVGPDGDLYVSRVESLTHTSQILRLVRHGEATAAGPATAARSVWADDAPGTVHTVAGSGKRPPPPREPRRVPEDERVPGGLAVGRDGTVYVAEPYRHQVRAIAPDGTVRRFAGTGASGETDGVHHGDVATEVVLNGPAGVAAAQDGVYVTANGRLYRVTPDGKIDTVATAAETGRESLDAVRLVATGPDGAVHYADYTSIHRLTPEGQELVVGYARRQEPGTPQALRTILRGVRWFAVGADGSVRFVQEGGDEVEVARPDGTVGTLAGTGTAGYSGDGGPAGKAAVNNVSGVAVGADGVTYFADTGNDRVRRVDRDGVVTTVAGTGKRGGNSADVPDPTGVAVGQDGTLHVLSADGRVRAVGADGAVRTVADLDPDPVRRAADVPFSAVESFAVGRDGTVYVASATGVHATRPGGELRPVELSPPLVTFAKYGPTGPVEAGPLATGPDGSLYLVPDAALRRHPDGVVVALLGGGMDNRMARRALREWASPTDYTFREGDPRDIAVGADGTLYLSTGDGVYSVGPDGALDVVLEAGEHDLFGGIALAPDGTPHLITYLSRVDRVVDGKAEPVVGRAHDATPAFDVTLTDPEDVAFTPDGVMFVSAGPEIHRFSPDGTAEVVHRGEHGPVTQLDVGPGGDLYFLQPDTAQVLVLVKAADAPAVAGSASTAVEVGAVVAVALFVLVGGGIAVARVRARRRSAQEGTG